MSAAAIRITAHIDGRPVPRADVLAWEARRSEKVLKKLGLRARSTDTETVLQELVARKLELGHESIKRLLGRELAVSDRVGRVAVPGLSTRRRMCTIELAADEGSAEMIPQWYRDTIMAADESALLRACPDHYVLRTRDHRTDEVIETPGGAPVAVRIFLDESDLDTLKTPADSAFPVQWAAVARNGNGVAMGGIRHQFRDQRNGFHVRLTAELPAMTLPRMVGWHRWHLACEFSNWLEAANATAA